MRGAVCFPARREARVQPGGAETSVRGTAARGDRRDGSRSLEERPACRVARVAASTAAPRGAADGRTSAAAIRKSRPRSARGALSLADAEPSIDESNIPMKILPGRSIRNLRKARQRAINNVARGKEERVERADTTHARARPTSSRVHVLTDVAVFSPRENLPLRLGVGRLLLSSPQPHHIRRGNGRDAHEDQGAADAAQGVRFPRQGQPRGAHPESPPPRAPSPRRYRVAAPSRWTRPTAGCLLTCPLQNRRLFPRVFFPSSDRAPPPLPYPPS